MKKTISLVIILLLLASNFAVAKDLSLQDALKLALENNYNLETEKKLYQQRKAELKLYQTKYAKDFSVGLRSNYSLLEENIEDEDESSNFIYSKEFSSNSNLTLTKDLLTKSVDDQVEWAGNSADLTYNYYLFKEYDEVKDYDNGVFQKRIELLEAEKKLKELKDNLKERVLEKYYDLIELEKKIKIKEEIIKQNKETLEVVKAKVEAGEALLLDQKEARLQLTQNELDLEQLNSQYKVALASLEQELNFQLSRNIKLIGQDKILKFSRSLREINSLAYANDLEVGILKEKIAQKEYNIEKLRTKKDFDLKLINEVSWDKSSEEATDYRVGLQLDYNFDNYEHKLEQNNLNKQQIKLANYKHKLAVKEDKIALEVDQQLLKFRNYQNLIKIYQQRINNAQEKLEIAQYKYKLGLITISDLLDKQVDLVQARVNHLSNLINHNQQVYKLKEIIGQF